MNCFFHVDSTMSLLAYIDPTGGLPPSFWGMFTTFLAAGIAAILALLRIVRQKFLSFLKKRSLLLGIGATFLLGWFIGGILFNKNPSKDTFSPRVLVLAFDGLDPILLNQYMAQGRLPNFSELTKKGIYHPLKTTNPPQSPVAWSSFITGNDPGQHGVFDFIKRDPKRYFPDLAISDRWKMMVPWKGTPFWEKEGSRSLGVTALHLPLSFPPPKLNGRLLSGMGVWDVRGTEGTYFFYSTQPIQIQNARGILFPLRQEKNLLFGHIPGPYRAGESDDIRELFEIDTSQKPFVLRLQGKSYPLPENRWSDWVQIEFRIGALKLQKVPAVTRVFMTHQNGQTSVYISPLNFNPAAPFYPISYPKEYCTELCDAIGHYYTRGMPHDTQAVNDGVLSDEAFLEQCRMIIEEREKMLHYELKRFEKGLLFAYFETSDIVQHMFWRSIDREHPLYATEESIRYRHIIPEYYERCDAILGRARVALGQKEAVVVISDHGFAPFRKAVHLNALLRDLGFLVLKKGKTSPEFFAEVDWKKTKAYALGFNAVYLNLANREGNGIVSTSEEVTLAKKIALELERWKDEETNSSPIKKVYLSKETYSESENVNQPDLIVGYTRGYRASWETALGMIPEEVLELNRKKWSGDHCIDGQEVPGIFLSSKPQIDAESLSDVGAALNRYLENNRK